MHQTTLTIADREAFQARVLNWYHAHGRKDLPWQKNVNPYRVWISEIMLQQTQVSVVIPYYHSFMKRFPEVESLADAPLDDVLGIWSGLGYYSRARNLYKAAGIIVEKYRGELPGNVDDLISLPGIGRSTAGAILSLSLGESHPILDGNVKRVLARCFTVEGWPGKSSVLKKLWGLSETLTPETGADYFNQAMMDLGATLCSRTSPQCGACPLGDTCLAYRSGRQAEFPEKKPRKKLPERHIKMLAVLNGNGEILLEKRPPSGIWGGLWSLPEQASVEEAQLWARQRLGAEIGMFRSLPVRRHSFSHFHLDIEPLSTVVNNHDSCVMDADRLVWYKPQQIESLGIAAPVSRIIEEIRSLE